MELSLVHKKPIPGATCVSDVIDDVYFSQPRKQKAGPQEFSNASRDKCLTAILLSDWHRVVQAFICEAVRKDQAGQRLAKELTERWEARQEEQERRDRIFRSYCYITNMRMMKIMCGQATEYDLRHRMTAPVYERNCWGLRYVERKEPRCWAPLGRVLTGEDDEESTDDEVPPLIED